ncbi:diguanylate cyclase [Bacillaceae bacterium S4-13-56]
MTIDLFKLLLISGLLAIGTNYIRFKTKSFVNRLFLVVSSLILVETYGLITNYESIAAAFFLFVIFANISFPVHGAIITPLMSWVLVMIHTNELWSPFLLLGYLFIGISVGGFKQFLDKRNKERIQWQQRLIKNSKQLNVFREVSTSMQNTHNRDRILRIILTSVTAGHGLGFNRAMILLVDEEINKLQGIMGVGPMSSDEGYKIWERITKEKYKLSDLIEIQDEDNSLDPQLNERVRELVINIDEENFLHESLEKGKPLHIKKIKKTDKVQLLLAKLFGMEEIAVFPLINQGVRVGVLIIDNPVNKRPITSDDIDSVIPLANQAAIAIQQANLYGQVKDMALKDGLTGLLNHWSFQATLAKYSPVTDQQPLSLILLDIDYFKHFNDTNGHLLGNEVLILLAKVIGESICSEDYAFRFGGEEFVILLVNTSIEKAVTIAERVRSNVEVTNFPNGEKQPSGKLTISLGVASTSELNLKTGKHLVDVADKALYKAKAHGKNKVVSYKEFV